MKSKNISKKEFIKKKVTPIKESLFLKSFHLAKSNPNKVGLMILFDVLFLVSLYGLQTLFQYFAKTLALPQNITSAFVFISLSLIFYLAVIFAYSFFKYSILDSLKSLFEATEFSFKRLGQFYLLNVIITGIFFAVIIVFNFLLASIKQTYAPFVFIFLAIPYLLFLYVTINMSHPLFYEGSSVKESINQGFKTTFTRIKAYRETILIIIMFALLTWILFLGSGYLIRLVSSKNYSLYLNTYAYFKQASIVIFDIVFYFVILINRISFYYIIRETK